MAAGYDWFMAGVEARVLRGHRRALLSRAAGRVLEIGGGTGANLPFYRTDIEELVVTEPEEPMARKLDENLRGYPLSARAVRASAEDLPFDDGRFDVVVSTLVLCSVGELSSALQEARRVLTSNG
jgi:ubiquinone/menaquinone biosynthesis C-methylase UbiE